MPQDPNSPATSILLIDGSKTQRAYWADQLKSSSSDFQIIEAADGQSGLALFQSYQFDCVVLELSLPDRSGLEVLMKLIPNVSRPQVPVVVLTLMTSQGVWELAKENGAYACLHKHHTTGDDLDRAIQRAVAFVRQMPKEERQQDTET
jgi:CheY-like chemotaxis protein